MDWIRRVVVDIKEPEDKDVLWIDSSDPNIYVIKIYDKGSWKPLIGDKIVVQSPVYQSGLCVDGTTGAVDISNDSSIATVNLTNVKRLWFLGMINPSSDNSYGYAFYDVEGRVIEHGCFPQSEGLVESQTTEIECRVPYGAVMFRTTLYDKVNRDNFYCNAGKLYVENVEMGGVGARYGTTEYWSHATEFRPASGELVVYSDYKIKNVGGTQVLIPNIKVGTGDTYIQDLPFLGEYEAEVLTSHINNSGIHVTTENKTFWSNKLNIDQNEVIEETLIFNRN